jgi:DNA-binding NtrC family response regulator
MKRILIVDDAATVRMFHRQHSGNRGYAVDEAVNGIEALEKALLSFLRPVRGGCQHAQAGRLRLPA